MTVRTIAVRATRVAGMLALPLLPVPFGSTGPAALHAQEEIAVPDSVTAERIRAGSDLYNGGSCVFCHAVAGRGTGRRAPDLSDVEWLHGEGDFTGIKHTIVWGVEEDEMKAVTPRPFQMNPMGGMPWGNEQLSQVTAYVWSLSRPSTSPFVVEQFRFLDLARAGRVDESIDVFRASDHALMTRQGINRIAYEVMGSHGAGTALALFELNAELHPDHFNPWDSLAEAHMTLGNRDEAIEYYERSLEVNPDNDNAVEKLEELGAR